MTPEELKDYIVDELGKQPRHNVGSLASAITDIAEEQNMNEDKLMRLLLANEPVGVPEDPTAFGLTPNTFCAAK